MEPGHTAIYRKRAAPGSSYAPRGVLAETLGEGVRPVSQYPCLICGKILLFSLIYLWPDHKLDALFMTIAASAVAVMIIYGLTDVKVASFNKDTKLNTSVKKVPYI